MKNAIKPEGCTNLKLCQLTCMVTRHYDARSRLVAEISASGVGSAEALPTDVTDEAQVIAAFDRAIGELRNEHDQEFAARAAAQDRRCQADLDLDRYAALHAQRYGEAVDAMTLIPRMLEAFMAGDWGFGSVRRHGARHRSRRGGVVGHRTASIERAALGCTFFVLEATEPLRL